MILMFNKQYRQENKLFNTLADKIKKSSSIVQEFKGQARVFELDTIDIYFTVANGQKLKVVTKTGEVVVPEMDCSFKQGCSTEDVLQRARHEMFSQLLDFVHKTYEKKAEKAKKMEQATKELQEKQTMLDKAARDKAAAEAVIATATNRLKSL